MILGDHSYDRSTVDRLSTRLAQLKTLSFNEIIHMIDLRLYSRNQSFHTSYTTLKPNESFCISY